MTDRVKGFTVTLEKDIRIDDVQCIIDAISMIKGVLDVEPSISTMQDHMIKTQLKIEMKRKIIDCID